MILERVEGSPAYSGRGVGKGRCYRPSIDDPARFEKKSVRLLSHAEKTDRRGIMSGHWIGRRAGRRWQGPAEWRHGVVARPEILDDLGPLPTLAGTAGPALASTAARRTASGLRRHPGGPVARMAGIWPVLHRDTGRQRANGAWYAGCVWRQRAAVGERCPNEAERLPPGVCVVELAGLPAEPREKLVAIPPVTWGKAAHITGTSPRGAGRGAGRLSGVARRRHRRWCR